MEAGELRGFLILCMKVIDEEFWMEGKECKDQKKIKYVKENMLARAREMLQRGVGDPV